MSLIRNGKGERATENQIEDIGGGIRVCVSEQHTFGTDSFLLSDFARPPGPRRRERACDLGTGCGIIPLLWFREQPFPKEAWAVDIQPAAVALATRSVELSGLESLVHPLQADLRQLGGRLPAGVFDLVTCNPPYNAAGTGVPSGVESSLIARHETLCTIDDVCAAAAKLLRFGGRLCLCQLPERLVDVLTAMRAHRLEPKRLRMVQQTASSPPWLFLVEGKLGREPHLVVEPPLLLREGEEPSADMRRIYRYYGKV